jgi:4-hydroxy-3-polyprenylbenzoate decarboxylase
VTLKEGRKLILVTREMPLSLVDIENMKKAKQAGAVIMPASPGFYNKPKTIDDLLNNVVSRILDQVGIDNDIIQRWGEPKKKSNMPSSGHKIVR